MQGEGNADQRSKPRIWDGVDYDSDPEVEGKSRQRSSGTDFLTRENVEMRLVLGFLSCYSPSPPSIKLHNICSEFAFD